MGSVVRQTRCHKHSRVPRANNDDRQDKARGIFMPVHGGCDTHGNVPCNLSMSVTRRLAKHNDPYLSRRISPFESVIWVSCQDSTSHFTQPQPSLIYGMWSISGSKQVMMRLTSGRLCGASTTSHRHFVLENMLVKLEL